MAMLRERGVLAGIIGKWEGYVRGGVERKGRPPELY